MKQYTTRSALIFLIILTYTSHMDSSRFSKRPSPLLSYSLPDNRELKKSLNYQEDTYLNFTELATKYKYPHEVHTVITEDGYILQVFRILSKCNESVKRYPVLLVHGVFDTADAWIIGSKIGLGYLLADNCYDVWASNSRGNFYSRHHTRLDPNKDPEYWEFSFEDIGYFDAPAIIDYILKQTRSLKLSYIGHSQGTTQYFTMSSLRPEYCDKINIAIQLAPVAWMKYFAPLTKILASNAEAIQSLLETVGYREVFARDHALHSILGLLCEKAPKLCELGYTLTTGYHEGTMSLSFISVSIGHLFSGTSVKNLLHFAQLIVCGKFQRYDEGKIGNLIKYNSPKPPQYNVSMMSTPVVLVAGKSDLLASLKDVNKLASRLTNLVELYIVPRYYWSHHNSIWGNTAPELVFTKILYYLQKFNTI